MNYLLHDTIVIQYHKSGLFDSVTDHIQHLAANVFTVTLVTVASAVMPCQRDTCNLIPRPHMFQNSIFILLDWLPNMSMELSLSCYLSHSWGKRRGFQTFPKSIFASVNVTNSTGIWTLLSDFWATIHYTTHKCNSK